MEARYYEKTGEGLRCRLCPHNCLIGEGMTGICRVRHNTDGVLMTGNWGIPSAIHFDPVEKKPLYHFHPGKSVLSVGSVGCNMKCTCCQNWQISQTSAGEYSSTKKKKPEEFLNLALSGKDNIGLAYTYNEPTVWYEYMDDIARIIHDHGLRNIMVTNGFINEKPLKDLLICMDAFNVDLKGFTDSFYKSFTGAGLEPVLRTLKTVRESGRHLEITNLVIPSVNDDPGLFKGMVNWIAGELGTDTVLHLSRYHPDYKQTTLPTSAALLERLYHIAREKLSYVYIGNIYLKHHQDTCCANCGELLISRTGYQVQFESLKEDGSCGKCGSPVIKY